MTHAGRSLPTTLSLLLLIAVTLFVCAVRPMTRPTGQLYGRLGLTRMSLLSEAADDTDTALPVPAAVHVHVTAASLVCTVLLLVLKTRRRACRPLPLRRLKLPVRSTERSVSSH